MPSKYIDRPYAVGKGKPPVHTQFGKGQPANRGGRRKGSKNGDTILREALEQRITIVENGKERKISKYAASVMQVINRAAQGDLRAFAVVLELKRDLDARSDVAAGEPLSATDRQLLADLATQLSSGGRSDV